MEYLFLAVLTFAELARLVRSGAGGRRRVINCAGVIVFAQRCRGPAQQTLDIALVDQNARTCRGGPPLPPHTPRFPAPFPFLAHSLSPSPAHLPWPLGGGRGARGLGPGRGVMNQICSKRRPNQNRAGHYFILCYVML